VLFVVYLDFVYLLVFDMAFTLQASWAKAQTSEKTFLVHDVFANALWAPGDLARKGRARKDRRVVLRLAVRFSCLG
jgi:hypothetical protein